MIRRRTIAPLLAVAVLALSACAAPEPESTAIPPVAPELSGEVSVYAAASLQGAFDEIAAAFETKYPGVDIVPVYDGSSTLVTQILEGAPAAVFASADEANMDKLEDLAVDPELFATNTLVIAVPADNPADVETLADLAAATTVLCAPEVPCGAASQTLLQNAGVSVTPASLEQNVTAVLTKVATGEADAGLVYATDAIANPDVEAIVPEGAADVVNRYPIATLEGAAQSAEAQTFVEFVLSGEGQAILAEFGFGAP